MHVPGDFGGWGLTEAGHAVDAERIADELEEAGRRTAVAEAYDAFVVLNPELLDLCTTWQTRSVDGFMTTNDHTDPGYDARVLDRLTDFDQRAAVVCADLSAALLRFRRYRVRLGDALARAKAGDLDARDGQHRLLPQRVGLPVPPGFVISTQACRSVSMPGMMRTILNLGLTAQATAGLAAETGDPRFALDSRLRFLTSFASAVVGVDPERREGVEPAIAEQDADADEARLAGAIRGLEALVRERAGEPVPDDATRQLELAVAAVFPSWDTPRRGPVRSPRRRRRLRQLPDPAPGGAGRPGADGVGRPAGRPGPHRAAASRRLLRGVHLRGRRAVGPAGAACPARRAYRCPGRGRPRRRRHDRAPRDAGSRPPKGSTSSPEGWGPLRRLPSAGWRPPPAARPGWPPRVPSSWCAQPPPRSTCTAWPPPPGSSPPEADGTGGEVVVGNPRVVAPTTDPHLQRLLERADEVTGGHTGGDETARLIAAHAVLRQGSATRRGRSRPGQPGGEASLGRPVVA
jgi:hypothetical protein